MKKLRKKIYAAAGYNTIYMGSGRKEFNPSKPMRPFEEYLKETAAGTAAQMRDTTAVDEGIIGSFMSSRFIKQGNLPGFLPFMLPALKNKPCTAVEGACGTGGRAIAMAARSVLSDLSDTVFVAAFEIQNTMKAVYGADVLAGAGYRAKERKEGDAFFFPGVFAKRAGAYFSAYGEKTARQAMAKWYEQAILNARKNPKAHEYHNTSPNLFELGMTPPDSQRFVPFLNQYDCSKVSDGASSIIIGSAEGLQNSGIDLQKVVEIIGIGEAEADITEQPTDLTVLATTEKAVGKALEMAGITLADISVLELHDCFSITALLSLEAIGLAKKGKAPQYILEGNTSPAGKLPTNLSGGLCGFGHPTGASGVRELVDLQTILTNGTENLLRTPFGMMISMGGNDKTVTCIIVKI